MLKASSTDIIGFCTDINNLLNLASLIDRMYAQQYSDTFHYLKALRRIVDRFNEKYPGIHVAVKKTSLYISLRFMIKAQTAEEIFDRVYKNRANFEYDLSAEKNYHQNISNILALKNDTSRNMIEVIYRNDTLNDPKSPEFMALAHYALESFNRDISIKDNNDDIFCFEGNSQHGHGLVYTPKKVIGETNY